MNEEIFGIKKIKKFTEHKVFIPIPFTGIPRNLAFNYASVFSRLGAKVKTYDIAKKINYYFSIINHEFLEEKNITEAIYSKLLQEMLVKDLLFHAAEYEPTVFFFFSNTSLNSTILKTLKKMATRNIVYIIDDEHIDEIFDYYKDYLDKIFSIYNYETNEIEFLPPGCDITKFSPKPIIPQFDVVFIGSYTPYRAKVINFLLNRGIKVKIFGKNWDNTLSVSSSTLSDKEVAKIFNNAKIVLNLPQQDPNEQIIPWLNTRLFEAAGCASCIITHAKEPFASLFEEDEEIILFENLEDLLQKINYLLSENDLRKALGQKIAKKIRQKYSISSNVEKILT